MVKPRRRPRTVRCKRCKTPIKVKPKGPIPIWCSNSCRQLAYQRRRYRGPLELLAQDIATAHVRAAIRAEVWDFLKELGFVDGAPPKPVPPKAKPSKHLRLVSPTEDSEAPADGDDSER